MLAGKRGMKVLVGTESGVESQTAAENGLFEQRFVIINDSVWIYSEIDPNNTGLGQIRGVSA